MSKKTQQLNVRVTPEQLEDLEEIAKFERAKIPELIREWIREKVNKYKDSKRFQKWKEREN